MGVGFARRGRHDAIGRESDSRFSTSSKASTNSTSPLTVHSKFWRESRAGVIRFRRVLGSAGFTRLGDRQSAGAAQQSLQVGMVNMRTVMPALQRAKSMPLPANGLHYLSASPPKQQRQTRVVKDLSAEQIAHEIAEWIQLSRTIRRTERGDRNSDVTTHLISGSRVGSGQYTSAGRVSKCWARL